MTVDTEGKRLIAIDIASGDVSVLASSLPVGAPRGIVPKFLGAIGDMAGPMINFAGCTAGEDGTIYFSADGEGSVMALRPAL